MVEAAGLERKIERFSDDDVRIYFLMFKR